MGESVPAEIHGRCGCGRRYRIRNAQPDQIVTCPNCRRAIMITRADLRVAGAGEQLVPLQPDQAEVREALLLDEVELRPAAAGSGPGLTGRQIHTHEASLLSNALHPGRMVEYGAGAYSPGAPPSRPGRVNVGAFLRDLLASLWFAGRPRNAAVLACTAVGCALPLVLADALGFLLGGLITAILCFVLELLILLHLAQFFWHVLTMTAGGDDELPVVPQSWDWIDDGLKPILWLIAITFLCSLPAVAVREYAPAGQYRIPLIWAGLLAGSFVWPIAVLSVALGGTLTALRPDWLARSVWGIGPAYITVWAMLLAVAGALIGLVEFAPSSVTWPAVAVRLYPAAAIAALFYLAYVLFRTLGLLHRHFGPRLP